MAGKKNKVLVLTSCTGEKAHKPEEQLTLQDFAKGPAPVEKREKQLKQYLLPAEKMYTGLQHVRLMRGLEAARASENIEVDLWILSAGYGLIPGSEVIAPYEATFSGMKVGDIADWSQQLDIPQSVKGLLSREYDLALVLLGDDYLRACQLDDSFSPSGAALFLTSKASERRLPKAPAVKAHVLGNKDAKKFACGLVGLKGEVGARILENIASGPLTIDGLLDDPASAIQQLENKVVAKVDKTPTRANPSVDKVISIPKQWWDKPHRTKLRYFIPEWDDLVDPDYDFETDEHSGGTGNWSNEVYAHQLYPEPNYDGILMSRAVAEKSKDKKERINQLGVHRYLRVPREFPVMGDCGAFDYIQLETPPYTTADVLDYYTRLDFDYGVSVDHLIVGSTMDTRDYRYQLTIENAHEFLREHRAMGLEWTPIGAVQGWDPNSYAEAARKYVRMGYRYIGLGGLVRSPTKTILQILEAVHKAVPSEVGVHLFGLARIQYMHQFANLGVRSVDSASLLRKAWLGTGNNYFTLDGYYYTAIRIPQTGKSYRAKRMVSEGKVTERQLLKLEADCWKSLRAFDAGRASVSDAVQSLMELDHMITPDRPDTTEMLRQVLEAKPWQQCPCSLCRKHGIEIIVFRGNNRNRRRGFHNTFVFYELMQRALQGKPVAFRKPDRSDDQLQIGFAVSAL